MKHFLWALFVGGHGLLRGRSVISELFYSSALRIAAHFSVFILEGLLEGIVEHGEKMKSGIEMEANAEQEAEVWDLSQQRWKGVGLAPQLLMARRHERSRHGS